MDHQVADIQRMFDQERPYVEACSVADCYNPACVLASHAGGSTPFCFKHSDRSVINDWFRDKAPDMSENQIFMIQINEIK